MTRRALCLLAVTGLCCATSAAAPDGGSSVGTSSSASGSSESTGRASTGGGSTGGSSTGGFTTAGSGSSGGLSPAGSTSGGTGFGTAGGLPLAEFAPADATTYCQQQATCQPEAAYFTGSCIWLTEADLSSQEGIAADVDAGRVVYDPAAAQACMQAEAALGCAILYAPPPAACAAELIGELPLGAACYDGFECDAGYCTVMTGASCPGRCAPYLPPGASCAGGGECDPSTACAPVLDAAGAFAGSVCQTPQGPGASCADGQPCDYPEICVGGICNAPGSLGESCGITGPGVLTCQAGLYCNQDAGAGQTACAPQIPDGGACGVDLANVGTVSLPAGEGGQCQQGLVCAGFALYASSGITVPGTCEPPADVDAGCLLPPPGTVAPISGCLPGLACVGGICQVPPTSGPCGPDPALPCQELLYYCNPGTETCEPSGANGAACSPALAGADCLSGDCGADGRCESTTPSCAAP